VNSYEHDLNNEKDHLEKLKAFFANMTILQLLDYRSEIRKGILNKISTFNQINAIEYNQALL